MNQTIKPQPKYTVPPKSEPHRLMEWNGTFFQCRNPGCRAKFLTQDVRDVHEVTTCPFQHTQDH